MIGDEIIHKVKEQYEHYPYPRFEEEQFARPAEMPIYQSPVLAERQKEEAQSSGCRLRHRDIGIHNRSLISC